MIRDLFKGLIALVSGKPEEDTPPDERRQLVRLKCRIPVEVHHQGEASKAIVVDIGLKGMQLRSARALEVGQEVEVIRRDGGDQYEVESVKGQVAWTKARRFSSDKVAGIVYQDPRGLDGSWVRYILTSLGLDEETVRQRRQHLRVEASIMLDVYDSGGRRLASGQLVNIGVGGCLAQLPDEIATSAPVTVEIGPYRELPVLRLPALALDCSHDRELEAWLGSLKFTDLDGLAIRQVGDYVIRLLKESKANYSGS